MLIYPVTEDIDETAEEAEPVFDDLAVDLSPAWVVEVRVEVDEDDVRVGPLGPREAWDLALEIESKRSHWVIALVPLYEPLDADELIDGLEAASE